MRSSAALPPHISANDDRHRVVDAASCERVRSPPFVFYIFPCRSNGISESDMILRPFISLVAVALAPLILAQKVNDIKEVELRQLNEDNFESTIAKGAW